MMGVGVRAAALVCVAAVASAVAGCCNCATQTGRRIDLSKLPPPISLGEQVSRLEERMLRIPRLRGEAAINGVTIRYVDEKGNAHEEHAEDGRLLIHQRFGEDARGGHDPGDVRLVGMAFGNRVFEAGRNSNDWWFMMLKPIVPESEAWIGDAHRLVEFREGQGRRAGGVGVLRADVVPVLLGVSPWAVRPAPEEAVALKVDDLTGVNDIMVFGPRNDLGGGLGGRTSLRREVVIDRMSGNIEEVRLYDEGGVLVMRSLLRDYREAQVQREEENGPQEKGPLVPYQVTLEYPARKLVIGLVFDRVVIPLRDVQYVTPDEEAGLKIHRVE